MQPSRSPGTTTLTHTLASAGITVFERGWLSSNNVLIQGDGPSALVDSGYASHAQQTKTLVQSEMGERTLSHLLNTHLHSDHCGGNAALQAIYPNLQTWIPPGLAPAVANWDPIALTFEPTGQFCPPFSYKALLVPGEALQLGTWNWDIHAAKGHDPHAVVLFQPELGILISADALWQNGFGIVFPELDGESAFDEVADTLDLIEALAPRIVIPGHGSVFDDVADALHRARSRLAQFVAQPDKHRRHALKVLVKFKLLEWQQVHTEAMLDWVLQTPYFVRHLPTEALTDRHMGQTWLDQLLLELERSNALRRDKGLVYNN